MRVPPYFSIAERTLGTPADNIWNDPGKVLILKKLWAAGLSCSVIAARIGTTRNSIIGKARRLNLSSRASGFNMSKAQARKGLRAMRKKRRPRIADHQSPLRRLLKSEPLPGPKPNDIARKSLLDLEPEDCRYVVGDPLKEKVCFCALPRLIGSPYCPDHSRLAYAAANVRTPAKSPSKETVAA